MKDKKKEPKVKRGKIKDRLKKIKFVKDRNGRDVVRTAKTDVVKEFLPLDNDGFPTKHICRFCSVDIQVVIEVNGNKFLVPLEVYRMAQVALDGGGLYTFNLCSGCLRLISTNDDELMEAIFMVDMKRYEEKLEEDPKTREKKDLILALLDDKGILKGSRKKTLNRNRKEERRGAMV